MRNKANILVSIPSKAASIKSQTIQCQQTIRRFHSIHNGHHSWSILNALYQKQYPKDITQQQQQQRKPVHYASLLLNITNQSFKLFEKHSQIWYNANLRLAVDGSANCLANKNLIHTANIVCGDFDSIDPKLLEKLRCPAQAQKLVETTITSDGNQAQMPQVVETPNQKATDFTKAIRLAMSIRPDIQNFLVLYHFDGSRIDHLFGLVNTLHLIKKNIVLVNIGSNTISWLLMPGHHTILKPKGGELCSLIPFTGPTEVKTQGLMYDMGSGSVLNFGGLISTSNICKKNAKSILVDTNRDLLWSIDMLKPQTDNMVHKAYF